MTPIIALLRGNSPLNIGSLKTRLNINYKAKKGLINIARKNTTLQRKEIVYTKEEWNQIKEKAAVCHLKTATFIRAMSLDGSIYVYDMKELAPLLNGMRIISNNINQVARKANETNNVYAADVEKLKGDVSELCRTVSNWLSTITSSKL